MQSKLRGKLAASAHAANTRVQQSRGSQSPIIHPGYKKLIAQSLNKFGLTAADNATGSRTIRFDASISEKKENVQVMHLLNRTDPHWR